MRKVLGILGGMGPEATSYIFQRIIKLTGAKSDKEHIEIVIHNNTRVPDRSKAILHGGENPEEEMLRSARLLERAGVDLIIIPCMTSHFFVPGISGKIRIPILHAIDETAKHIQKNHPKVRRVGVLSTTGTYKTRLFPEALEKIGLEALVPEEADQEHLVMSAIYSEHGIKAGNLEGEPREKLLTAAKKLVRQGAEALIAGCTEIPLAIRQEDFTVPFIDPMEVLALRSIEECRAR